jgi:hypothetical protein
MVWKADELSLVVQRHFGKRVEGIDLSWITDGMNPTFVILKCRSLEENASQDEENLLRMKIILPP